MDGKRSSLPLYLHITLLSFGLVLANILANPLRRLAPSLTAHVAQGGFVILSGLLPHQADSVVAAYRDAGLKLRRRLQIEGWSSLLMQRR